MRYCPFSLIVIKYSSFHYILLVAANQDALKHFLFDLVEIQNIHPWLGTSVIQTETKEGIGIFLHHILSQCAAVTFIFCNYVEYSFALCKFKALLLVT